MPAYELCALEIIYPKVNFTVILDLIYCLITKSLFLPNFVGKVCNEKFTKNKPFPKDKDSEVKQLSIKCDTSNVV